MKKSCVVCQSGGPTAVINSSLAGVVISALNSKFIDKVYGSLNGISGLINDKLIDMSLQDKMQIQLLLSTPGAALGSVRYNLSNDYTNLDYKNILSTINKYNIGYVILIGGNDSMDTTAKLAKFFKDNNINVNILGVPKTVDNDLINIDHTPGYGSAIKYIATTIAEIKIDTSVYEKGRVTVVEIMGRGAGWLTAGAKLAELTGYGPDLIYLPEVPFNLENALMQIKELYEKNKKVLVVVSEGIKNEDGSYFFEKYRYKEDNDVFGHMQLEGTAVVLADIVHSKLNIPVRNIILNLPQRCSSHLASKTDINEAFDCGVAAINLIENNTGKMVTMENVGKNGKYEIEYKLVDVASVANFVKQFPKEWIINGNDISNEFIKYSLPLIQGEIEMTYENGLPVFAKLNK